MFTSKTKAILIASAAALAAMGASRVSASTIFDPGDIVVYRVGAGSATLTSASTAVFLDDYDPAPGQTAPFATVPLPTAASGSNKPLTSSGTAGSEGGLTLSSNGQYLMVPGYDAAPGTSSIANTSTTGASAVPRDIGEVDAFGNINTSTTTTAFSGNNPRSAASDNGTNIWMAGANNGVDYTTLGGSGAGTAVSTTVTNLRELEIYNGQLYVSSNNGSALRVGTVGANLPTTTGQTTTNLTGIPITTGSTNTNPVNSPYSYVFATLNGGSSPDTLYIADNGLGNSSASGAIEKFSLVAGSWTYSGSIAETGITGLIGEPVTVDSTTEEELYFSTPTNLYSLTDTAGYDLTMAGTTSTIATAASNESFRGIAFAPVAVPEPASLAGLVLAGALLIKRPGRRA